MPTAMMEIYEPNAQWELISTAVDTDIQTFDTFPDMKLPRITLTLSLKRNPSHFCIVILLSCAIVFCK